MKHVSRLRLCFCGKFIAILVFVLLAGIPWGKGLAFFEVLDDLTRELDAMEQGGTGLEDLVEQLDLGGGGSFKDIKQGEWYTQYVARVAQWGIVSGYKDTQGRALGVFGPGDPVTIAEILKMALKAAKVDETACKGIARHPQAQGHWAYLYVVCAEEKNFRILQYPTNLNGPALRGEVLAIMHDAFGDKVPPLLSVFKDTAYHPYETDIAYAAALGVVSGDTDSAGNPIGTFRPNDEVNRAEATKIIYEKLKAQVLLGE
ncbi:S-layer homology domain-containing protein [Candidatus Peregrinibacteria bacterium]|nr:S-layer homology domain-containing protein [Candidatus Peregrinibacteria bacterium]